MVSFQCDGCADTVKKPKLDSHRQRCHAPFTCLDCSTTFNGQEYKSHTSCISEAQKYQGALYKGDKKGKAAESKPNGAPAAAPEPAAPVAEAPAASSSIHPSRLQAIESGPPASPQFGNGYARGGRGGRAGFGFAGRGGGGGRPPYGGRSGGATGENRLAPDNGMRSWGSTPVNGSPAPETPAATVLTTPVAAAGSVTDDGEKKKKKKKKGDKGGTGAKANSKRPKDVLDGEPAVKSSTTTPVVLTTPAEEPSAKKRKRDPSPPAAPASAPAPATTPASAPSDKTLKRIRKNVGKLDASTAGVSLGEWLEKIGKGKKDETINRDDVLNGLKVGQVDGKWVLQVPA